MTSTEFSSFLQTSTKIVQRALSDGYDYLRDYSIGGGEALADEASERKRVRLVCSFADDRWTRLRSVTSVDWSPKVRPGSSALG